MQARGARPGLGARTCGGLQRAAARPHAGGQLRVHLLHARRQVVLRQAQRLLPQPRVPVQQQQQQERGALGCGRQQAEGKLLAGMPATAVVVAAGALRHLYILRARSGRLALSSTDSASWNCCCAAAACACASSTSVTDGGSCCSATLLAASQSWLCSHMSTASRGLPAGTGGAEGAGGRGLGARSRGHTVGLMAAITEGPRPRADACCRHWPKFDNQARTQQA
jgi:hypothetical protein